MSGANIFAENAPITKTDHRGRTYKWCRATGASGALADGDVVIYNATLATNASYAVTGSTTADDDAIFGVATETITSGSYGWIQVWGIHTGVKIDGTTTEVAIGSRISVGTVTKKANVWKGTATGGALGITLSTVTTGSDSTYTVLIDPR